MQKLSLPLLIALLLFTAIPNTAYSETLRQPTSLQLSEQKAIQDTLRQWIEGWAETDTALDIKHFKYKKGWAWIETAPHYADGKKHEPRIDALLKKNNGKWEVVYAPCDDSKYRGDERPEKDRSLQHFLKPPYGPAPLEIFRHDNNTTHSKRRQP